jgi:hypothetical protein
MSLTGWVLVLGAAGTVGFFGRKKWMKKKAQSKQDQVRKKLLADQAELDRIACLDLGKSLMSSAPGSFESPRDEVSAGAGKRSG